MAILAAALSYNCDVQRVKLDAQGGIDAGHANIKLVFPADSGVLTKFPLEKVDYQIGARRTNDGRIAFTFFKGDTALAGSVNVPSKAQSMVAEDGDYRIVTLCLPPLKLGEK